MTPTARTLKILCLVCLFAGLIITIAGIVGAIQDPSSISSWLPVVAGALLLAFGVRGSILANVPSNAPRLQTAALATTGTGAVATGVVAALGAQVFALALCIIAAATALITTIQAHRLKKELERV